MKVRVMLRMRFVPETEDHGLFGTFLGKPARSSKSRRSVRNSRSQHFRAQHGEKAFATHWSSKSVWRRMSCKIGFARSTTTGFMCQNAHHRGRDSSESCHGITKMWRAKARTKLARRISKCSPSSMARTISTTRNLWKDRYRCDGLQG